LLKRQLEKLASNLLFLPHLSLGFPTADRKGSYILPELDYSGSEGVSSPYTLVILGASWLVFSIYVAVTSCCVHGLLIASLCPWAKWPPVAHCEYMQDLAQECDRGERIKSCEWQKKKESEQTHLGAINPFP
jgi:hypothetical protein